MPRFNEGEKLWGYDKYVVAPGEDREMYDYEYEDDFLPSWEEMSTWTPRDLRHYVNESRRVCSRCGHLKADDGKKLCAVCREHGRKAYARRLMNPENAGKCRYCVRGAEPGKTVCHVHAETYSSAGVRIKERAAALREVLKGGHGVDAARALDRAMGAAGFAAEDVEAYVRERLGSR